ncbi:MAG TPA: cupin domain-containing protein [Gemmatimonadaceae bacterium]|nr:cupin domain-containing protein [Gemmatimonadaceae bacterium]
MCTLKISAAAFLAGMLCLAGVGASAQEPKVTPVMMKNLTDIPGKQLVVITVEYAPGGADAPHRHNADALVYVLEGSVIEQVKGGKPDTLKAGQTFYEGPADIHIVGRNASQTEPAKLLAILVKKTGAPAVVPVKQTQ